jgi:hypothetical protein
MNQFDQPQIVEAADQVVDCRRRRLVGAKT